jgi:hypothetical protein
MKIITGNLRLKLDPKITSTLTIRHRHYSGIFKHNIYIDFGILCQHKLEKQKKANKKCSECI